MSVNTNTLKLLTFAMVIFAYLHKMEYYHIKFLTLSTGEPCNNLGFAHSSITSLSLRKAFNLAPYRVKYIQSIKAY